jgi:hypothetical protein
VTLLTDDPSTIDEPRKAAFKWSAGEYVSTDRQRGIERCAAADGAVVANAYDVTITTRLRVVNREMRGSDWLATVLEGEQQRVATPRPKATKHGCTGWTVSFASRGQRNLTPGGATQITSGNWAGYVVHTDGAQIRRVRGSWIQPAIRCVNGNDIELSSYWIGLDGSRNGTVEQTGTAAECRKGVISYSAWWETFPDYSVPVSLRVRPGDRITADIVRHGDRYRFTLTNETTGKSFAHTVTWTRGENTSAEWIAEATSLCPHDVCQAQVLPDFGPVRFTDATASTDVSGYQSINDPSWALERDVMVDDKGLVRAEVGALSSGGSSFTVTWRSPSGQ